MDPMSLGTPSTSVIEDIGIFRKTFDEQWMFRSTLRNSMRAIAAARRSIFLRTPMIVASDPNRLRIDYELLEGWSPLRDLVRHRTFRGVGAAELDRLFWTIGAALQEFHNLTHRIHGDFDLDNILYNTSADRVAFVDFTPPDYAHFATYNQGDPYRDIALFVIYVSAKYPPQNLHLAFRPTLRRLCRRFIAGYFHASQKSFCEVSLTKSMEQLLDDTYLGTTFSGKYLRSTSLFRVDDLSPLE